MGKSEPVLILGAGPSGITSAFELNREGKKGVVVEKNERVGGLARTLQFKEFRTDIGPHRFYSKNDYLYRLISDILGDDWKKVSRFTRFYIDGQFFRYPIKIKDIISKVSIYRTVKILSDYVKERIKYFISRDIPENFEEYIISHFGRTLAELNMLNYTRKIWGLPCSEISSDWAKQRIKGLSLKEVIKKLLLSNKKGPKTMVDQFYYPVKGAGMIYSRMKEEIEKDGRFTFLMKSKPVTIERSKNKIEKVYLENNSEPVKPGSLISSIPITDFIKLLKPEVPDEVKYAGDELKYRAHTSLFITVDKNSILKDQWIYFPDREIPFGRITEPKNFSSYMSPEGKSSLFIEFFCWPEDRIWKVEKDELFNECMQWVEKFNFIKREEVIDYYIHREKYAYPVYDMNYRKNSEIIKNFLNKFENLQLTGRTGTFRYNNQDHAMEMGILAARNIIEDKNYKVEKVGSEQEYFEKGYLK